MLSFLICILNYYLNLKRRVKKTILDNEVDRNVLEILMDEYGPATYNGAYFECAYDTWEDHKNCTHALKSSLYDRCTYCSEGCKCLNPNAYRPVEMVIK